MAKGCAITKPAANLKQLLAAVPTRNTAVREETRGGALVLFVPIRKRWWTRGPMAWCLPLRDEKGVALDALGQEVWQTCDGQRDLETMVEDFAARHRLGFHEARLTVMRFLRMLAQRNLLVLVGEAAPPADDAEPSEVDSIQSRGIVPAAGGAK